MRTIRTKVYQFDELNQNAKFQALLDQIKFEIETMDENSPFLKAAEEMERLKTPWFLGEKLYHTPEYREILEETIRINGYEFTKDGKMFHK